MKHFKDISELLTLKRAHEKDGRNLLPEDMCIIKNASIVFDSNRILWVGETADLPKEYSQIKDTKSLKGLCVTPSLVDSHTHLIFGGNRANEYMMRLNGADYQEIAKSGGGILYTMNQTNSCSDEELFETAKSRIETIASYGVYTIEVKSGYSLTYEGEERLSLIIDKLKKHFIGRVKIFNTFMAAHAIPKSFARSSEYISKVVLPLLETLSSKKIIDAVDIFHEQGYFSKEDVITLFDKAKALGLQVKMHADEFNDNQGALLASSYNALSADHLLATTKAGAEALAKSQTVATVLPGTGLFLGKPKANTKLLLEAGCKLSLASDYNPGSCHCDNVLLLASISAPMYPLNTAQMWSAITLNAASALGFNNQGAVVVGLLPEFSIFKCETISEITYNWGKNLSIDRSLV